MVEVHCSTCLRMCKTDMCTCLGMCKTDMCVFGHVHKCKCRCSNLFFEMFFTMANIPVYWPLPAI